jgi:predicted nucleic acid-binding protein
VSVFVDTSTFFAVLDADDANHDAARPGLEALREFAADVLPIVEVHVVDEGQHRSAFHALLVASRRRLSLVDCASFECMRRAGLERVFCFDPHFTEQGFSVVPA